METASTWIPCMRLAEGDTNEYTIRLLVIEDRDEDQEQLLQQMRRANIRDHILFINRGRKAIDLLLEDGAAGIPSKISAIFLRDQLPDTNGLEILRLIRSRPEIAKVPVIVMSDTEEAGDSDEYQRLNVTSRLSKPLDFQSFSTAVSQVFTGLSGTESARTAAASA
jgi:two-component system, response regulator